MMWTATRCMGKHACMKGTPCLLFIASCVHLRPCLCTVPCFRPLYPYYVACSARSGSAAPLHTFCIQRSAGPACPLQLYHRSPIRPGTLFCAQRSTWTMWAAGGRPLWAMPIQRSQRHSLSRSRRCGSVHSTKAVAWARMSSYMSGADVCPLVQRLPPVAVAVSCCLWTVIAVRAGYPCTGHIIWRPM